MREWFHTQGTAATGASTQQHKPEEESLVRSKMSDIVAVCQGRHSGFRAMVRVENVMSRLAQIFTRRQ